MQFYNTLTKKKEEFIPHSDVVTLYTCGPTVYNYAHIGNLRTYIFEDILEKSLKFCNYKVKRVMNITDVGHLESDSDTGEDKIQKEAIKENKTSREIADFYTKAFFEDCLLLHIKKPEIVSNASSNISFYIKMIEKLLEKGYAYQNENVYFDVSKAHNYLTLSGMKEEELKLGSAQGISEDRLKRNQQDFALWFVSSKFKNQEMKWDSPFGYGYPGWHIECSGISLKYLGEYLDIHCGGVDNIFPHHTNEIAQSEAYLGHKWCSYWLHAEHLNMKEEKMSKSKGNFLTIKSLIDKGFNPLSYRFMCLNSHYRNHLIFNFDQLEKMENEYLKLKKKTSSLKEEGNLNREIYNTYIEKGKEIIGDDLNTSLLITLLYDILKLETSEFTKRKIIERIDEVLSLDLLKNENKEISKDLKDYIEEEINIRNKYKREKNYEEADKIRNILEEKGIYLKDTKDGTEYEIRGEINEKQKK